MKLTEKEIVLRHWYHGFISDEIRDKMYTSGYGDAIKRFLDRDYSNRLKRGWWGGI